MNPRKRTFTIVLAGMFVAFLGGGLKVYIDYEKYSLIPIPIMLEQTSYKSSMYLLVKKKLYNKSLRDFIDTPSLTTEEKKLKRLIRNIKEKNSESIIQMAKDYDGPLKEKLRKYIMSFIKVWPELSSVELFSSFESPEGKVFILSASRKGRLVKLLVPFERSGTGDLEYAPINMKPVSSLVGTWTPLFRSESKNYSPISYFEWLLNDELDFEGFCLSLDPKATNKGKGGTLIFRGDVAGKEHEVIMLLHKMQNILNDGQYGEFKTYMSTVSAKLFEESLKNESVDSFGFWMKDFIALNPIFIIEADPVFILYFDEQSILATKFLYFLRKEDGRLYLTSYGERPLSYHLFSLNLFSETLATKSGEGMRCTAPFL